MTFAHNFRAVFIYLGRGARSSIRPTACWRARCKVKERLPNFDGAKLDDIIDYLTYVFVPALVVWQADLVPVAVSDLRGDAAVERLRLRAGRRQGRQPRDHFFTGFPSYWNIVVAYLYLLQLSQRTNAIILAMLRRAGVRADSLRLPVADHDAQVCRRWRWVRCGPSLFTWMIWRLPAIDGPWTMISLIFPVYYCRRCRLWLQFRR